MDGLAGPADPNVLVGFNTSDDAGVYRLNPECALVQTTDFFTPIVDDPFTYGAIAAANSLSDVYAMGGRPLTALSLVCYPNKGDIETLRQILRGGAEKMREAGCAILGGHSVSDDEIKFGYAVTGTVHPERFLPNSGARPGDTLVLTKPLGTGIISTGLKRGLATEEEVAASVASMLTLNKSAAEALEGLDAHGCTDVTGFGLIGHAREMALGSGVTLKIQTAALRFLPGAERLAEAGAIPGGLRNNRDFAGPCVKVESPPTPAVAELIYDPQTSGGLLISMRPESAAEFLGRFPAAFAIGVVRPPGEKPIILI